MNYRTLEAHQLCSASTTHTLEDERVTSVFVHGGVRFGYRSCTRCGETDVPVSQLLHDDRPIQEWQYAPHAPRSSTVPLIHTRVTSR